jgi:hypothetical protein
VGSASGTGTASGVGSSMAYTPTYLYYGF